MKKTGFTLFELLVSISIIAILTALATISYSAAQKKARDSKRIQDMQSIQKAEEQWYMLNNSAYKAGFSAGNSWTDASGAVVFVFPSDPKASSGWTDYASLASMPTTSTYCVCALLESATGNANSPLACPVTTWVNGTGTYFCVSNQQ